MYSVLIVDDEMIVRLGIKAMIDWEKIGFNIVGEAKNGEDALQLFEELRPSLVITDIKMPIMDGIELMRQIRKRSKSAKVIILSCLQDFEYAKEAIKLGATDYLMKSDMMPADLEKVLLEVRASIKLEQNEERSGSVVHHPAAQSGKIVKEKFLWDLSLGIISKLHINKEVLDRLDLSLFDEGTLILIHLGVDYYEKLVSESDQQRGDIRSLLAKAIHEEMNQSVLQNEIFSGNEGEWSILLSMDAAVPDGMHTIVNLGSSLIEAIQTTSGISVTAGISQPFSPLSEIRNAYREAQQAYRNKLFVGCGQAILYDPSLSMKPLGSSPVISFKGLNEAVYAMREQDVELFLEQLFSRATEMRDPERFQMTALELLLNLNTISADITKEMEELAQRKKLRYEQIKHLETVEDMAEWFMKAYQELIVEMGGVYAHDRNIIPKAIHFIQTHFSEELSLQTVSDYVYVSKNYFANLFKKETGESFVEYVTKIRIEKAKTLMINGDLKTADVGSHVGIGDVKYFSKVFKKTTGLTPTEYKERFQKNDHRRGSVNGY